MRSTITILTGIMLMCSAMAETVTALRPAINDAAAKHGVDPVLMEAIIRHESANATSYSARRRNNLAGIMGRRGQRKYESKEACVNDLAQILAKYRAKGRVTVAQIGRVYCSSHSSWTRHVNGLMGQIRNGKFGALEQQATAE
ncbi:MAG: glucosaminidase domain-containing protein [Akkermansia sp.]|nr:glucosaminidase domain-containing protein [Akkermansia sp.]MDO5463553.1 glucosaminidase domain-containing protein [Akkermansia sp.]